MQVSVYTGVGREKVRYDLVPIKGKYRGMGRSLLATDLLELKSKRKFELLLEEYFEFLEYSQELNKKSFDKIVVFCEVLREHNIPCEIIVYNDEAMKDAFGYSIEFLGIDIVHDMCESLISEEVNLYIQELINENGLCSTVDAVYKIIPYQDHGEVEWKPCYVYRVIL